MRGGFATVEGSPPLEAYKYDLLDEATETAAPEIPESPEATEAAPFGDAADIKQWLNTCPEALEEIFETLLVAGVVGGIFAQGGVGKTYFLICLAISAATGKPLFKTFKPTKPMRVLAVFAEDPGERLHQRLIDILAEHGGGVDENLLASNLRLFCGHGAPLMGLDNNNPTATDTLTWFKREVDDFEPALIIIDPKSMFYGLDENNNDHNARWVMALKELTEKGASVLFSHHVTKALSGLLELNGARGGSALVDGSRFAASMRTMTDEDAKKYGVDEPWKYVEFKVTKNSYMPKLPGSIFFRFTPGGGLEEVDLRAGREYILREGLAEAIEEEAAKGNFYTRREIIRGAVLPEMTGKERTEAIKLAISGGRLTKETMQGKGRSRTILVTDKKTSGKCDKRAFDKSTFITKTRG